MTTEATTASGNEKLGSAFGRLWGAAMTSNLADGIARLAIPLAAVSITKDPVAIALLTGLVYVPWLLFSVPSGMIVDRIDRRIAMAIANGARLLAAAGVALFIATDNVTIAVLAIATLIFGLGETLFDNATNAITPSLVKRGGLDRANGRIQAAQVGIDMFVATPISGVLFSIAVILPMIVGGAGYFVAALLVLTLPVSAARSRTADGELAPSVPLKEAVGFVWHHRYLRSLVLFTTAVGTAFALAQAVTALLYLDQFAVSPAMFGVVTTGIGVGGVAGSLLAGVSVKKFGRGHTMLWATIIGGLGLMGVGFAPNVWLATLAYAFGAAGVSMWNVPWGSLRQAIIPGHMLGRAIGAIRTFAWSLMPLATLAGGWIATVDLQLPFIVGGAVSVLVCLVGAPLLLKADQHFPADAVAEEAPEFAAVPEPVSPA
jgi:MFS family permease